MSIRSTRQSIKPTYDSRETGPRYHVTTSVNGRTIAFQERLDDPFARHTVYVSVRDVLRGLLLDGRLVIEVTIGGDVAVMDDVLELDANTLLPNSTRRQDFNQEMDMALRFHAIADDEATR